MNENTETDQGIYIPNEDALTEQEQTSTVQCPKCERLFKSQAALRMHNVRSHGKGWSTTKNFRRKGRQSRTEEQRLATRREYQKQLRERYYAEGRNSRGEQMPPGWKPQKQRRDIRMPGWSPERRAKFASTWRSKNRSRNKIQIVYPDPKDSELTRQQENERRIQEEMAQSVVVPTLKYCPNCGEHLEGWKYQS